MFTETSLICYIELFIFWIFISSGPNEEEIPFNIETESNGDTEIKYTPIVAGNNWIYSNTYKLLKLVWFEYKEKVRWS